MEFGNTPSIGHMTPHSGTKKAGRSPLCFGNLRFRPGYRLDPFPEPRIGEKKDREQSTVRLVSTPGRYHPGVCALRFGDDFVGLRPQLKRCGADLLVVHLLHTFAFVFGVQGAEVFVVLCAFENA